jgi:hypothetical protein
LRENIFKKFLAAIIFIGVAIPESQAAADPYVTFHTSKNYLNHINRGYIALDTKNYPLALKEFLTAKYINDELFAAYDGLGRIYELTRNYAKALDSYQRALDLISPKYAQDLVQEIKIARQNRETRQALGLYKIVLSIRPESGLLVMYGDKYRGEGNLTAALNNYRRAYRMQEDPEDYLKYLKIKYPNKDYERYIIRKYIQKSLRYPEAHYKAGLVDLQKKDFKSAIDEFSTAVSQISIPSVENKYINSLAEAHFKKAVAQYPYNPESLNKSAGLYEQAANYGPRTPATMIKLAEVYYYRDIARMESYDKDIARVEKENHDLSEFSDTPDSELNSLLNKKYKPAYFDTTLDILKNIQNFENFDPGVYYSLGNVYFKKGQIYHKGFYDRQKYMNSEKASARDKAWNYYQKALEDYKTYIKKNPNNGTVYYDVGLLYYQASKLEPDKNSLPITKETQKEYERWGPKFYKRDMLTRSIANFKTYLNYHPGAANRYEVNNLVKEMQLAMVVNW